jgi:hypothetical protein
MADTAIINTDTIISPLIGPLTANTAVSFYFRVVSTLSIGIGAVARYQMRGNDAANIYVGTSNFGLAVLQYTIDSANQNPTSGYVKVVVAAPSFVNHLSGKFMIDTSVIVIPPVLTDSVTDVACRGQNTGGIKVFATGATPPYTYLWSPGGQTTDTISGLAAGVYTVTVTDSLGATATLTDTVTQPALALLLDSLSKTPVLCYGGNTGTASIYASGGTAPLHYIWSNNPPSTAFSAQNLTAGNYDVTVTDNNGCILTATTDISQPFAALTAIISSTPSSSGNGTALVSPNGGTSPFSYLWSTMPVQTGSEATGLAAGTYEVTITDVNGCTLYDTVTVGSVNGISALAGNDLTIYPNPATDQVHIRGNSSIAGLTVSITDMSGREIIAGAASGDVINTAALASGIYILRLNTDAGTTVRKLMIQR